MPVPRIIARSLASRSSEVPFGAARRRVVVVASDQLVWRVLLLGDTLGQVVRVGVGLGVPELGRAAVVAIAQGRRDGAGLTRPHVGQRGVDGADDRVRLGRQRQVDGGLGQVDARLGHADQLHRLRSGRCGEQRGGICEPHVFGRMHDEATGDEPRVLTGLDHAREVVQRGVGIGSADRLDERADHVVVLVTVAVVAHRRRVDGLLERCEVDRGASLGLGRACRCLERGQRAPGVTAGHAQQMPARIVVERHRRTEPTLVAQGPVDEFADCGLVERLQREQQAAREQRRHDREERILRRRRDERDVAGFDGAEQRVLLGLAETVDLVDEQHGLSPGAAQLRLRARDHLTHVLDAGVESRELLEASVRRARHDQREGGLAGAGRPEQDQRHRRIALDQTAKWRSGREQMVLPDDLVQRAWPHAGRQRRSRIERRRVGARLVRFEQGHAVQPRSARLPLFR